MCGITGFFDPRSRGVGYEFRAVVTRMSATLAHRGPDDMGVWIDEDAGVALGHRRLSIIDLSPQGHQPMISRSQRYVMVFNGEIYNYRELKSCLEDDIDGTGPAFRGTSDTEVMLAAFDRWGLDRAVCKFNGMFAFAVWDRQDRTLTLCRDRCGEKPLYYGWTGGSFLFGSELKAFRAHPAFRRQISRDAAALFIRYGYVPGPYSIYENIWKLPPATILRVRGNAETGSFNSTPYWSAKEVAESGLRNPLHLTDDEAVARLDSLLSDAVRLRMVADVPVGGLLSGGIDSSVVVALMQKCARRPVRTFTIGFSEADYGEAAHAKKVAEHLGCEHSELHVSAADAIGVIPKLPVLYDEPFADSSQIPTYLISKLAQQHVNVALSGDGGDEVFGGYYRYKWAPSIWQKIGWLPIQLRRCLARVLARVPYGTGYRIGRSIVSLLHESAKFTNPGDKLQKFVEILPAESTQALYHLLVSQFTDPTGVVLGSSELPTPLTENLQWAGAPDFVRRMMFLDTITYLPDDILVKVDRASMGVSLESRVPFLDHRIIELSWRLPLTMKIRDGETKWLLRQVLYKYVPRELLDRPKSGFGVPLDEWLRGPLREWAEELLDAARLGREGFFDPAPIRRWWAEHLSERHNRMHLLWNVLMFQAWLEHEPAQGSETLGAAQILAH